MRTPAESSCYPVAPAAAAALRAAAHSMPRVADQELRVSDTQRLVFDHFRSRVGAAFVDLVQGIRVSVARPPYVALVRGLPADDSDTLLAAISAALGSMVEPYQQAHSRIVRHITPGTERLRDDRPLNEFLHTDSTDWPQPNDATCLFCVRADQNGGGQSRLLDVDALVEEMSRANLLTQMEQESLPWRIADELGGGVVWEPVLRRGELLTVRWLRYTVEQAYSEEPVDERLHAFLSAFEHRLETSPAVLEFLLAPGDCCIMDNRRVLHGRTAIFGAESSQRLLLRTKVMWNSDALPLE